MSFWCTSATFHWPCIPDEYIRYICSMSNYLQCPIDRYLLIKMRTQFMSFMYSARCYIVEKLLWKSTVIVRVRPTLCCLEQCNPTSCRCLMLSWTSWLIFSLWLCLLGERQHVGTIPDGSAPSQDWDWIHVLGGLRCFGDVWSMLKDPGWHTRWTHWVDTATPGASG